MGWGVSLGSIVGGVRGSVVRVVLALPYCIWNASPVSLLLPTFDDKGFLDYPPLRVVYPRDFHPGILPPVSLREIGRLS